MIVREAKSNDIDQIVALLEHHRIQLEDWEPRFWKKSQHSAEMSKAFLGSLIDDQNTTILVVESGGSILGCLQFKPTFVPPVYEPGGTTWMVDDFVVSDGEWATVGSALLHGLQSSPLVQHEDQLVFPVPARDSEAAKFFRRNGLSPTTTWWTTSSLQFEDSTS